MNKINSIQDDKHNVSLLKQISRKDSQISETRKRNKELAKSFDDDWPTGRKSKPTV